MDFSDTPQEAEYRAKVRAFLDTNAKRREPGQLFKVKYGSDDLVPHACEQQLAVHMVAMIMVVLVYPT